MLRRLAMYATAHIDITLRCILQTMSVPGSPITRLGPPRGTARDALQLPRPYRVSIVQSWSAIDGQNRCAYCDGLIGHLDLDYAVPGVESELLHFHSLCYDQSIIEGLCKR